MRTLLPENHLLDCLQDHFVPGGNRSFAPKGRTPPEHCKNAKNQQCALT
jgi:hypothetical protein